MTFNELGEKLADKLADNAVLTHENRQLRAERDQLREALHALYYEQNDAPIERDRAEWERAMDLARAALRGAQDE